MCNNDGVGAPQQVVQPIFDDSATAKIQNEYKGGHRNLPVAQDVVDDFVKQHNSVDTATREGVRYEANKNEGGAVYDGYIVSDNGNENSGRDYSTRKSVGRNNDTAGRKGETRLPVELGVPDRRRVEEIIAFALDRTEKGRTLMSEASISRIVDDIVGVVIATREAD